MILYHFTTIRLLRPDMTPGDAIIPPEGLTIHKADVLTPAAVWLTADPTPGQAASGNCVRITVKMPRADRKLIRFARFAKALSAVDLDHLPPGAWERIKRDWWLYRDAILPERWTDIEIFHGQQPWWLSPSEAGIRCGSSMSAPPIASGSNASCTSST